MDKIMYKTFLWPRNPEYYTVSYNRELVYNQETEAGQTAEMLGELRRTITGNGVFSGEGAWEDFQNLAALCEDAEAGWLVHPVWGRIFAFLVKLEMTQEPRENYISYSFQFLETPDSNSANTE